MNAHPDDRPRWTIEEAERLLQSLQGVVSARVVARPGGAVDEIHVLTTADVKAKQTVRNVESALLAHFDLSVDHRKISVAQTAKSEDGLTSLPISLIPEPEISASEARLLFYGHQVETERSNVVRHRVEIEWLGDRFTGEAKSADLPRPKLEAVVVATLEAVSSAIADKLEDGGRPITLSLDGVKVVDAFERRFVLVSIHAMAGRDVSRLAGTTETDESTDRSAILATLQAADRWIRGQVD